MRKAAIFMLSLILGLGPALFGQKRGHRSAGEVSKGSGSGAGHVRVNGYTKKRGTYVAPHQRSGPNKTQGDNWTARGNVNPTNGKKGTRTPKK